MKIIDVNKRRKENRELFLHEKYKNHSMEQLIPILYDEDRVKRDAAIFSLQLIGSNNVFCFSFKPVFLER